MMDAGKILKRGLLLVMAMGLLTYGCSGASTAMKEQPSGGLAKLENLSVVQGEEATTVLIELERPLSYTTVRVDDPPMLVVDIAGMDVSGIAGREEVGKSPVDYIEKSRDEKLPHVGRICIGLSSPVSTDVTMEGSTIVVQVENKDGITLPDSDMPSVGVAEVAAEPAVTEAASVSSDETAPAEAVLAEKDDIVLPGATFVQEVRVSEDGGLPTVAIRGNGAFDEPKVFLLDDDESNIRLVVDLFGVDAYADKDTIIVGDGLLKRVRMAYHDESDGKFRVVFDLGSMAEYDVKSVGSDVVVALAPSGTEAVARALEPTPEALARAKGASTASDSDGPVEISTRMDTGREITVTAETSAPAGYKQPEGIDIYVSQVDGKTILSSAPIEGGQNAVEKMDNSSDGVVVTKYKIYSGGKISFDLQDAKLDKVIKLLADVAGLNLLMNPDDVQGTVTLKLQNVPWDQALDILLRLYDLDKVIEGNVLRVAPSTKLSAEEKRLLREKSEMMQLIADAQPLYTKTLKINYVDASEMESKIKGANMLSKRGEITTNSGTNELIITDIKENIDKMEQLAKLLDKRVNQIMIEARIVTVDTGFTQSLGLSWGIQQNSDYDAGQTGPAWATSSGTNSSLNWHGQDGDTTLGILNQQGGNTAQNYVLGVPVDLGLDAAGLATGMSWLLSKDRNLSVDVTLSALETISKAETLAAPKVLTLENEQATITQGVVLYVQTTSASGTKPEPLNANLSLTVTPRVTGDNYIFMDVNATNNQPSSPPPGSTASINTQAVTTKVIVKNGDTIVLGGIYIKTDNHGDSQVPWLGRIPVLGWLFKERTINDSTQELLIFITPKIIKQNALEV